MCVLFKPLSLDVDEVDHHLFSNGIDQNYIKWTKHGVKDDRPKSGHINVNDGVCVEEFVDFAIDAPQTIETEIPTDPPVTIEMVQATEDNFIEDHKKFQELLEDAEKPLYKGCPNFTKLSTMVELLNLKNKYRASDKFFNKQLVLLKKMLPKGNEMMESTYDAKKTMKAMGSGHTKVHACINDSVLYRNEYKDFKVCPRCGKSRWKVDDKTGKLYRSIPVKVLWYFPIIPRMKLLFQTNTMEKVLIWHETSRKKTVFGAIQQMLKHGGK